MRNLQVGIFVTGSIAFLLSAVFMGGWVGDTLWRTGIAAMLVALAMRALWPAERVDATEKGKTA